MADRLQSYRNLVTDRQDAWKSRVGIPYLLQYDLAYKSYQDTMTAQKDADKERGELFVTAASLVIGSTLLGTVASASMQKLFRRSVVNYARRNLDLTMIRLINRTRHNQSVGFAIGKIFDEVKDGVTKQFQEIATRWSQANVDFITATPLSQTLQVEQILINNRLCAFEFADAIEANRQMTTAAKDAAFASLRRAPLAQKPETRPSDGKGTMAEKMELSFYLAAILDSDTLVNWPASAPSHSPFGGGAMQAGKATSRPIAQMPNDPKYPRPITPRPNLLGVTPAHQSVAIERAGGAVQKRTNELSNLILGEPVYGRGSYFGVFGPDDTDKPAELKTAQRLLDKLAGYTRPATAIDART